MRLALLLTLTLLAVPASAQHDGMDHDDPEAAVRATIAQLFDAMRAKDTTALRATMHPEARLRTAVNQGGARSIQESPIAQFVQAVAGAPVLLDEQIEDGYPVMIDDGLAVAWTPYRFYAGEQFSHCGTNAFTLAQTDDGWQIVHIMDTRRREGCDE